MNNCCKEIRTYGIWVCMCPPARRRMTWSSRGSSEKWGILLAHSTKVKSCLSAAWQILVTGSLVWRGTSNPVNNCSHVIFDIYIQRAGAVVAKSWDVCVCACVCVGGGALCKTTSFFFWLYKSSSSLEFCMQSDKGLTDDRDKWSVLLCNQINQHVNVCCAQI